MMVKLLMMRIYITLFWLIAGIGVHASAERTCHVPRGTLVHSRYEGEPRTQPLIPSEAAGLLGTNFPFYYFGYRYEFDTVPTLTEREREQLYRLHVSNWTDTYVILEETKWRPDRIGVTIQVFRQYKLVRSQGIDSAVGLNPLIQKYQFEYKGLSQGDTSGRVAQVMGKYDDRRTYGNVRYGSVWFEKDKVHILYNRGTIEKIEKLDRVPDWADDRININTAPAEVLETLEGIGQQAANMIVIHREIHGGFGSVDDLAKVRGIGAKLLERIRESIRTE